MAKKVYSFSEIIKQIKDKKYSPIYVLMGEEPFFIDQITDLLIENVIEESAKDFDQLVLYGGDTDAGTIINAARRFPMMGEKQLVVIKEAQQLKDFDQLAIYMKQPMPSTILVINHKYKKIDGRKAVATTAEQNGILFESKKIPDYKMPAFITSLLQEKQLGIDEKGAQMLTDYLGNDLSRLTQELDKMSIILADKGTTRVTPELIEENIGISKEYNVFELLKALSVKDILKANRIADYFAKNPKNNPIQMTLPIIFNYFSNLLICYYSKDRSERGIMQALDLRNPFQTRDYMSGLRHYKPMKVFNLISDIRTADAQSKGIDNASLNDAEIMKMLLYKILH